MRQHQSGAALTPKAGVLAALAADATWLVESPPNEENVRFSAAIVLTPHISWGEFSRAQALRRLRGAPSREVLDSILEALLRVLSSCRSLSTERLREAGGLVGEALELGSASSEEVAEGLLGELGPKVDDWLDQLGQHGVDLAEEFTPLLSLVRPRPLAGLMTPPTTPTPPSSTVVRAHSRKRMLERLGPVAEQAQANVGGRGGVAPPAITALPPLAPPPSAPGPSSSPPPPPPTTMPPPAKPAGVVEVPAEEWQALKREMAELRGKGDNAGGIDETPAAFTLSLTRLQDNLGRGAHAGVSLFVYPCSHHMLELSRASQNLGTPYIAFALLLKHQKQYPRLVCTTFASVQSQILAAFPTHVETIDQLHTVFNTLHAKHLDLLEAKEG